MQVEPSGFDGELLLAQDDGSVVVVNDDSLQVMRSATRHNDAARAYAIRGTPWVLSGTDDGDVRLSSSLDSSTAVLLHGRVGGSEVQELRASEDYVFRLEAGGVLRTWYVATTMFHTAPPVLIENAARSARLVPHTHDVVSVNLLGRPEHSRLGADSSTVEALEFEQVAAVSDSGHTMFVCPLENACRLWDVNSQQYSGDLAARGDSLLTARFSPRGQWLAVHQVMGRLQLFTVPAGKPIAAFAVDTAGAGHAWGFSADGRYLAFRDSGGVRLLDLAQPAGAPTVLFNGPVRSLTWAPEGARLAFATGRTLQVHTWNARGNHTSQTWTPRPLADVAVRAISASGTWAALDLGSRGLRIVRLDSSELSPRSLLLDGPRAGLLDVQFPADTASVLATTPTGETYVWQWRAGDPEQTMYPRSMGQRLLDWTLRTTGSKSESPVLNDEYLITRRVLRHYAPLPRRPLPAVVQVVLSDSGRRVISLVHGPWQRPRLGEWLLSASLRVDRIYGAFQRCLDATAVERDLAEFGVLEFTDMNCATALVDNAPRAQIGTMRVDSVPPRVGNRIEGKASLNAPRGAKGVTEKK
jgi:hypothetical protein